MNRELVFNKQGWNDYLQWQNDDINVSRKLNEIIKDVLREPFKGIGKPEPLKNNYKGYWSRRITNEHRVIYKVEKDRIIIVSCKGHYE